MSRDRGPLEDRSIEGLDPVASTEWFDVYDLGFSPHLPCAGRLAELDRQVDALRAMMGSENSRRFSMGYRGAGECPMSSNGYAVYDTGEAYVCGGRADAHEVAHLVHGTDLDSEHPANRVIMLEGFAESSERHGRLMPRVTPSLPLFVESWLGPDRGRSYAASGHFVRWFIERFGFPAFRQAYRTPIQSDEQSGHELAAILADAAGLGWPDLVGTYFAEAPVARAGFDRCSDPPELVLGEASSFASLELEFSCDAAHTWGPTFDGEYGSGGRRTVQVEVTDGGSVEVDTHAVAFAWEPCDDLQDVADDADRARYALDWEADSFVGGSDIHMLVEQRDLRRRVVLPPGRYALALLVGDATDPTTGRIALHRAASAPARVPVRPFDPPASSLLAPHL